MEANCGVVGDIGVVDFRMGFSLMNGVSCGDGNAVSCYLKLF